MVERDYKNLLDLYPSLAHFDTNTGERGLFLACITAMEHIVESGGLRAPVIIGSYLLQIMSNPEAAGMILLQYKRDAQR